MIKLLALFFAFTFATVSSAANEEPTSKEKAPVKSEKSEISDILDSMGYPELQVVPRASERLSMEVKKEDSSYLFTHWPIELSSLATMYIGITAKSHERTDLTPKEKKDATTIGSATTAVGAGWLIGSMLLGAQRPYRTGTYAISKYPGKDERSTLLRERLAEEAMERPAKVMRVLQNAAVISNFAVNVATAIHSNESGAIMAEMAALFSLLPWIFEDYNISVYDKHIEYKKKIYAPLKTASIAYDPVTHAVTPVTQLTWTF